MVGHTILHCLHLPLALTTYGRAPAPTIVGYVHAVYSSASGTQLAEEEGEGGNLDIAHLKVQCEFQRRGLGSLLLAGLAQRAEQLSWDVNSLRLVVAAKNTAASRLYRKFGFEMSES